jgi:hypothetical protein
MEAAATSVVLSRDALIVLVNFGADVNLIAG